MFHALSPVQSAEILSLARECHYSPRQIIFRQDDPARSVLIIASGRVKLTQLMRTGKEVILRIAARGELVDSVGGPFAPRHSLTAQTIDPTRLFAWDVRAFEQFLLRFPMFQFNAAQIVANRLCLLEERFGGLATERVPQRLARVLLQLSGQNPGVPIDLSCEELAQMIGTTLFTVSRLLCQWAENGIIEPQRRAIAVANIAQLIQIADGEDE
ncbi:MAG TPA: Crp/Fnr family transcriptional regulator [Terriglobales bacterium]|nr:Crp/Fnr family transcriptional regulator [Terriglobales bacterium]